MEASYVEAIRARALLARYETAWAALSERNGALCARSTELAGTVRTAADRCSASSAGFQHLQAELQLLPSCTAQLQEIATHVAAAGEHLQALEETLGQLTVGQIRQAEVEWRQQQMERADRAQAQRRRELEQLRERMAAQTSRRIEQQKEERRQVFAEQFEVEREQFIQRGAVGDLRVATRSPEPAVSLADAPPDASAVQEDFFAE